MRLLLLIFSLSLICCNDNKGYLSKKENNGDEVYTVGSDDDEMNQAILKAKQTYPEFLTALHSEDSLNHAHAVKMRFDFGSEKTNAEHMWLGDLFFRDSVLFGILNSDPVEILSVKNGDTLEIKKEKLSDWMYIRDNRLMGGYTIKVLYNKMTSEEKKQFDEEMGFKIE